MLDVLIIGGGPAGLGAAIYAKRAGLSVEVYEKNIYGVGQITETDRVDNYLGLWGVSGWDLAMSFQNHANEMGITPKEGAVTGLRRVSSGMEEKMPVDAEKKSESTFQNLQDEGLKTAEDAAGAAADDTKTMKNMAETAENVAETAKNAVETEESVAETAKDVRESREDMPCWLTEFEDGTSVCSKTVIYAAGAARRKLGAPGEDTFAGRGVSYCATCDGAFFRGQNVAVVGGGNAALDDALYLAGLCRRVYLIHRRNEFRGFQATVDLVRKKENIQILTPHQVKAITGEKKVEAVFLENGTELPVSGVFLAVGMQPATAVLRTGGVVELDASGYIIADETCAASAPGFYAAGDVRTKPLRQIITAAADGANAAMSAAVYIQGL